VCVRRVDAGSELDFDTMVERLRSIGLATHKLPQQLEILDALPITASGKTQKFELVNRLVVDNRHVSDQLREVDNDHSGSDGRRGSGRWSGPRSTDSSRSAAVSLRR